MIRHYRNYTDIHGDEVTSCGLRYDPVYWMHVTTSPPLVSCRSCRRTKHWLSAFRLWQEVGE